MKFLNKLLLTVSLVLLFGYVKAEECLIVNNENVEIPCNLYEQLNNYYSTNFLSFMTSYEYDQIKNSDLSQIETITLTDTNPLLDGNVYNPNGTYFQTSYKELRITRNGDFINANLRWIQNPQVRSYDVFGIRFLGPHIVGTPLFREYYTIGNTTYSSSSYSRKDATNGFGISVKLPVYNELESDLTFTYSGSGTIYASYQHAKTNVTLATSKKYTIAQGGYGNVLLFDNNVQIKYDNMTGVSIQG